MKDTVLYVEDNNDNIRLVERILRLRPNVELLVAASGHEGLRLARDTTPSVILLDRRLPDIHGTDVLRQLKAATGTAAIPVVMLSGDSGQHHIAETLRLGADDFLAKPFELNDFLKIIDRFCSRPKKDSR